MTDDVAQPRPLRPSTVAVPRRTLLSASIGAVGLAALSTLTRSTPGARSPLAHLTIACGERGGFYLQFGELLAARLREAGVARSVEPLPTAGSFDNLDLLAERRTTLALSQFDATWEQAPDAVALGRIYANYLHCAVRQDSPISHLAELSGATVSLGADGAGVRLTAQRTLTAAGLHAPADFTAKHLDLQTAVTELENRRIDALMWAGGLPTKPLWDLNDRIGLRMLDLEGFTPATRADLAPLYQTADVPRRAYPGSAPITTVTVANLLLCRPDLPAALASDIVAVLVRDASHLIPKSAIGVQFLNPNTLVGTSPIALHPGAVTRYQQIHG